MVRVVKLIIASLVRVELVTIGLRVTTPRVRVEEDEEKGKEQMLTSRCRACRLGPRCSPKGG